MPSCCSSEGSNLSAPRSPSCHGQDLTANRWAQGVWFANKVAFVVGWFVAAWRPVFWSVPMAAAGVLCVANATRCGRLHCYFTGPVFLAGAALTVLRTLGLISLSWNLLGSFIVAAFALAWIPELLFGKYARTTNSRSSEAH